MCKILIVDDDPDFVEITRMILEQNGYETATASNGQQALEKVQKEAPDIILLDIMMRTVLEGVQVSREIQTNPDLASIRVIMVTSILDTPHASMFPTDEYLAIDGWLTKPVRPETLLETVGRFCKHRRLTTNK